MKFLLSLSLSLLLSVLMLMFTFSSGKTQNCSLVPPNIPEDVTLQYVGSDYGIYTLSQAIAQGKMAECPDCPLPDPSYWPAQWIQIGGTFTFDDISACYCSSQYGGYVYGTESTQSRIIMEPDAKLIISGNTYFNFQILNASIYGCGEMWDQIQVLPGSRLSLANVQIADAVEAVFIESGSQLNVRVCKFRNNLYGIRFNPSGNHEYSIFSVRNSTFEGGGQGLKSNHSQFFNWSFVGIEVNNKPNVWDIGNNVFRNIQNGIIANNSRLYPSLQPYFWSTNVFHDIKPKQTTNDRNFGNGIYINGSPGTLASNIHGNTSYLSFGFDNLNYTENFKDCVRGIHIKGGRAFVFDNSIVECDTAILVRECNYPSVLHHSVFNNNLIDNSIKLGIGFIGNFMNYQADVYDNDIVVESSSASTGIRVFGNSLNQNIRINSNVVDIRSEGIGVDIESSGGVRIYGQNTFNVTSTGYRYKCIYAHGRSDFTQVIDNYFNGFDQGNYNASTTQYRVGVEIDDSEFTLVDCNVFDNVATSLMHKSYSTNAFIRSNLFRSGTDGYSLGSQATGGAYIGEQSIGIGNNRNEWPITTIGKYYPSFDARSFHTSLIEEIDSRFWVDYEDIPFDNNPYWPDKIQSVSGEWFKADIDVWNAGVNNCSAHVGPDPTEELSRIEFSLINDTLNLDNDYFNYRASWAFLRKLEYYPDLLEITGVGQWQYDMNQIAIGQLFKIQQQIGNVMQIDDATINLLDSISDLKMDLILDIYELDSILAEDSNLDSTQWATYDALSEELFELNEIIEDLLY